MTEAGTGNLPSALRPSGLRALVPARLDAVRLGQALTIVAYICLATALLLHRDAWLDEAHAWAWATHLSGPADFLVIPGEGHPPAWFWLLRLISYVLSFEQARFLGLALALVNAILLARVFDRSIVVLALILFSNIALHTWGYHFRPYALIFGLNLAATLLARSGRVAAGAWLTAIACGFHFLAGFLFGLYLLVHWRRGLTIKASILPMALGLLFGLSAVLSGMGNPAATLSSTDHLQRFIEVLAYPFTIGLVSDGVIVVLAALLAGFAFRKVPEVLVGLAITALLFAAFGTFVYAPYEWHMALGGILVILAFAMADKAAPRWPLVVLLVPQLLIATVRTQLELSQPTFGSGTAYEAIKADAGPDLDPASQIIAWPDTLMIAPSVSEAISFLGANGQRHPEPMNWRERRDEFLDQELLIETPTPYWLVCSFCDSAFVTLGAAGRGAELVLAPPNPDMFRPIWVYKVTTPDR